MTQILIRRAGEVLAVADSPEQARRAIYEAHDGLDGEGGHPFYLASGHCGCGLTQDDLRSLDGTSVWQAGQRLNNGWLYWYAEPVTTRSHAT